MFALRCRGFRADPAPEAAGLKVTAVQNPPTSLADSVDHWLLQVGELGDA
jgi:hypothetical protein